MSKTFIAACVQMNSSDVLSDNLHRAEQLLSCAAEQGAELAALPEFFPLIASDEKQKLHIAEKDGSGRIQDFLSEVASRHRMYIVGGAIPIVPEQAEHLPQPTKVHAACLLIAPDGNRLARYDKMHLFYFRGNKTNADETTTIAAGEQVVVADTPLGRLGLSICYDLRFPELYRQMQADIIFAPSAFTAETGAAHWHTLLRTRAIENLAHVIAPAQVGQHPGGRTTYGHSQIVDSWGQVLATAGGEKEEVIIARIDNAEREMHRQRLPALLHRKL